MPTGLIIFQGCIRHENGSWSEMFSLNTIGAEFFVTSKDSQNVLDYVSNPMCKLLNVIKSTPKSTITYLGNSHTSAMKRSAIKALSLI